jgi:hypothetical protein
MNTKLSLRVIPPIILIGKITKQSIFLPCSLAGSTSTASQYRLRDEAIFKNAIKNVRDCFVPIKSRLAMTAPWFFGTDSQIISI